MMTCIYDAWAARLGHSNIRLAIEPVGNLELFCEYRHVEKNQEKSRKSYPYYQRKISPEPMNGSIFFCFVFQPHKLDCIYRFLVLGFSLVPRFSICFMCNR